MIHGFLQGLGHKKFSIRLRYAFIWFVILLTLSYLSGLLFLPEGSMKNLPLPALGAFEGEQMVLSLATRTLIYNLCVLAVMLLLNLLRVRYFTFGYLPLYANTIIMGLFAGTNSFSGNISTYTIEGWRMFFQIGFLEFSAYILGCAATVGLAMYHANHWRGEKFKRIHGWKDISLSTHERAALFIAFGLLVIAAFNEWRYI